MLSFSGKKLFPGPHILTTAMHQALAVQAL